MECEVSAVGITRAIQMAKKAMQSQIDRLQDRITKLELDNEMMKEDINAIKPDSVQTKCMRELAGCGMYANVEVDIDT